MMSNSRESAVRPVYIVIRQSPDWKTQTYADLENTRAFCKSIGRREDFIIDFIKLWDRTFTTSFFATRQAMKEISLENFKAVNSATLVQIDGVRAVLHPNAFYLFIDDDDWYDPNIVNYLHAFDPSKCATILWRQATLTDDFEYPRDGYFWSNNYAVSGSYLLHRKKNLDAVSQHFHAQGTFNCPNLTHRRRRIGLRTVAVKLIRPGYQYIIRNDRCWSVKNEHPASTVALERLGDHATPDDLRALVRKTIEAARQRIFPPELHWAHPLFERVVEFFSNGYE